MTIYILSVVINLIFLLFPKRIKKNGEITRFKSRGKEIKYYAFMCLILCIIMAIRDYSVGIDTYAYQRSYIKIAAASSLGEAIVNSTFTGPGYILMCWLLHYISIDPRVCVVFTSIVINFLLYRIAKKTNRGLVFLLLWQTMYLFAFSLNANRQTLATLIQMNATEILTNDRKSIKGWALVLLGISIHPISTVIIFMYFISSLISAKIKMKILIIFSIISAVIVNYLMNIVVRLILIILPIYNKYVNGDIKRGFINNIGKGKIVYFYFFIFVVMIFLALVISKKQSEILDYKWRFASIIFIAVLGLMNSKNTTIFRIFMCLLPQSLPLLVNVRDYTKIKGYAIKLLDIGIHGVLIIYMILNLLDNQSGVVPYVTGTF